MSRFLFSRLRQHSHAQPNIVGAFFSQVPFFLKALLAVLSALFAAFSFYSYTQFQQHQNADQIRAQQQALTQTLPLVYKVEQASAALHAQALRQAHQNALDTLLERQQQLQKYAQNLQTHLIPSLTNPTDPRAALARQAQELIAQTNLLDSAFANQTLSPQTLARYAQLFETAKTLTNGYLEALNSLHPAHVMLTDNVQPQTLETISALITNERAHHQLYTRLWTHLHRAPFSDPKRPPLFLPQIGQPLPPLGARANAPTPTPSATEIDQSQMSAQNATAPLSNEQRYELVHHHFLLHSSYQKLTHLLTAKQEPTVSNSIPPSGSLPPPSAPDLLDAQSFLQRYINATERSERLAMMSPISAQIQTLSEQTTSTLEHQLLTLNPKQQQLNPTLWMLLSIGFLSASVLLLAATVYLLWHQEQKARRTLKGIQTLLSHQQQHALCTPQQLMELPTAFSATAKLLGTIHNDEPPKSDPSFNDPMQLLHHLDALWTFTNRRAGRVFCAASAQLTQAHQDYEHHTQEYQEQLLLAHERFTKTQSALQTLYALHQDSAALIEKSSVQLPQIGQLLHQLHTTHTSTQQLFDHYEHKLSAIDKWQQSVKEQVLCIQPATAALARHLSDDLQNSAKAAHLCHKIHQQCTTLFNQTLSPSGATHSTHNSPKTQTAALRQGLIQLQSYCNTLGSVVDALGTQSIEQHAKVRSLMSQTQKITHITTVGSSLARQSAQLQKRFMSQQSALHQLSEGLRSMHQQIQAHQKTQHGFLETLHQALQTLPVNTQEQLDLSNAGGSLLHIHPTVGTHDLFDTPITHLHPQTAPNGAGVSPNPLPTSSTEHFFERSNQNPYTDSVLEGAHTHTSYDVCDVPQIQDLQNVDSDATLDTTDTPMEHTAASTDWDALYGSQQSTPTPAHSASDAFAPMVDFEDTQSMDETLNSK